MGKQHILQTGELKMSKMSKKTMDRQAKKIMKQMGMGPKGAPELPGVLKFSSRGKKSNKHTQKKRKE